MSDDWGTYLCVHCGLPATGTAHNVGSQRGKQRCGSESGLSYGYNAHPPEVPCDNNWTACLGAVTPDPRLVVEECRIVDVDGEPVRVQVSGEWSEADHAAFAEIVRAAKARFADGQKGTEQ